MRKTESRSRFTGPGVLLFTPWYGGNAGGVAVITEVLAHALMERGSPCIAVEIAEDGWFPRFHRGRAGEIVVKLCIRNAKFSANPVRRLIARVRLLMAEALFRWWKRTHNVQVAHFHYSAIEYPPLAALCKRIGLDVVATYHGSDMLVDMHDPELNAAAASVLEVAHAATAVSHAQRSEMLRWFPHMAMRSEVVHNSVPQEYIRDDVADAASPRDIDVFFAGNLIPRKGANILLRAFQMVLQSHPEAQLVIAGDGSERQSLEQFSRDAGMSGNVTFLGRQQRAELAGLYVRAKISVVPSLAEALGIVVLEAQSCGAAVIASAVGGIPDIVKPDVTGVLVPPGDGPALADAIGALLNDDDRRVRIGNEAARVAAAGYFPRAMAEAYMKIYASSRRLTQHGSPENAELQTSGLHAARET